MASKPTQSIYELADQLGVSASTVSRVLNHRTGIGESTRRKVLASARAAGFRPRMSARQLTVAVLVDRLQFATFGGFVSCLLSCIVEELSKQEVAVEMVTQHNLDRLETHLIDGVLALTWDDSTVERLKRLTKVPVVSINRMDVPEFSAVATDHRKQGEMAVEYLASRGHSRIAMIVEERSNWGTQERVAGFVGALKKMGLPVDEGTVSYTEHQPMYGLLRRLTTVASPTAIFVANESLGLEASYILPNVLGIRVPQDVSLMGMESSQVSQFLSPPMTTISQPLEELAQRSLELLVDRVKSSGGEPARVMLASRLIERESVAVLAAGSANGQR